MPQLKFFQWFPLVWRQRVNSIPNSVLVSCTTFSPIALVRIGEIPQSIFVVFHRKWPCQIMSLSHVQNGSVPNGYLIPAGSMSSLMGNSIQC